MINFHKVAKTLFQTEDCEKMRNILLVELADILPSCPFCGEPKVYQNKTAFTECQCCGAYHVYQFGQGRKVSEIEKTVNYVIEMLSSFREIDGKIISELQSKIILPCPECGEEGKSVIENGEIRVRCKLCALRGPKGRNEEEAIYLWNRRKGRVRPQ